MQILVLRTNSMNLDVIVETPVLKYEKNWLILNSERRGVTITRF